MQKGRFGRSAPSHHATFLQPYIQFVVANTLRLSGQTGRDLRPITPPCLSDAAVVLPDRCCGHTYTTAI